MLHPGKEATSTQTHFFFFVFSKKVLLWFQIKTSTTHVIQKMFAITHFLAICIYSISLIGNSFCSQISLSLDRRV